jgi:hypothetical protein
MKYFVRQVPPERQENDLWRNDYYDGIIFAQGNGTKPIDDRLAAIVDGLDDASGAFVKLHEFPWYDSFDELIDDIFPHTDKCSYTENQMTNWLKLLTFSLPDGRLPQVNGLGASAIDDDMNIEAAFNLVYGGKWRHAEIHGSSQSDWARILYDTGKYSDDDIAEFETLYFNTGTEWIVHDEAYEPGLPEEITGYSVYVTDWNTARGLRDALDLLDSDELAVYEYAGAVSLPRYKIVESCLNPQDSVVA